MSQYSSDFHCMSIDWPIRARLRVFHRTLEYAVYPESILVSSFSYNKMIYFFPFIHC